MNRLKRILVALLAAALLVTSVPAFAAYDMPYYIEVDLTNQIVTIFNTSDNSIHRQMLCSAGTGDKTPTRTFYMPSKDRDDERTEWYWMPNAYTWVKWATKFYYAYFFHSIPFRRQDDNTMNQEAVEQFGQPASHGCIRLRVEDAEYIAKNCLKGTRVDIFYSGEKKEDLRLLLYQSSYTGEDGMTYPEFLGISENDLGSGCTGNDVLDLQHRMHDLGYYEGDYDGTYGTELISAVKQLQKDMGLSQTGISTKELLELIYSNDAPVSTGEITISEGESGPVVRQLQEALAKLAVYTGDLDSVYDVEVTEAVKTFQTLCGFTADGIAGPETQHAVYYMLNKIQTELGTESFICTFQNEELTTNKIDSEHANILIRSKATTESPSIGKVKHKDVVITAATEGKWAQIITDAGVGYIYKKYLGSSGTQINPIAVYSSADGKTFTLGETLAKRLEGESSLKEEIKSYYKTEGFMDYLADADVTYATVTTGDDTVKLNMRMEGSSDAAVLDAIPNGVSMRVLEQGGEWTKVIYNGNIGYLMSSYLSIWQGNAEDEADVLASQQRANPTTSAGQPVAATVVGDVDTNTANIYAFPLEDASILARAPHDQRLNVVSINANTGWVLIEHSGNQGYMKMDNLSFIVEGEEQPAA